MENNTNDTYQSKIVNRDFVNHVYDLCEKSKEYDWHKIIEPKNNENGGESKEDVKKRLKRAFNNIFKYLEPDSKDYIEFNALLYNYPNSYIYDSLTSFTITIYNIFYNKIKYPVKEDLYPKDITPIINQKFFSTLRDKNYDLESILNFILLCEIMSVDEHIFFETRDAYSYTLNRTQLTIIKKLSENKDCDCFIDIIERSIKKINYLINHINWMKNFIMTPQDGSKENEAYQYIICKLFCMRDYILFFINNLDIVINNFTNILENNKLMDDFIKHIENYQPSSSWVSNSIITYDFSSFLNFLLIQEFYKKQKEVYSNIEQVDDVDLANFYNNFKSYITDIRNPNITDLTDPKYLSKLKYSTNEYEFYALFSRFINESEENENYISKIKGHHNIIYYLKKFTENLEDRRLNINNNYFLEALSYIQLMLSKNSEQLKNTVKLKYSLYSTITDKLFSVIPDNKNYVYYDPTIVLTRIEELYIHVLNYINSVVKPIV